jgi:hypothetical protein
VPKVLSVLRIAAMLLAIVLLGHKR